MNGEYDFESDWPLNFTLNIFSGDIPTAQFETNKYYVYVIIVAQ